MPKLIEMDANVPLRQQLQEHGSEPVVLINAFTVDPADIDQFLEAWRADAAIMKRQPGFISTQLHRGIAGSSVFLNYAVWESTDHFTRAFTNPEFQASMRDYPSSAAASPHLFRKLAVAGICVD
jgi:heme-degrading monooxygenase HmoA